MCRRNQTNNINFEVFSCGETLALWMFPSVCTLILAVEIVSWPPVHWVIAGPLFYYSHFRLTPEGLGNAAAASATAALRITRDRCRRRWRRFVITPSMVNPTLPNCVSQFGKLVVPICPTMYPNTRRSACPEDRRI